jgi:hypothetical protein
MTPMGSTILVVPDVHLRPGQDMSRMAALGRLAADIYSEEGALRVVQLGDVGDFRSLSKYDRGMIGGENQRYTADCDSVTEGLEVFKDAVEKEIGKRGYDSLQLHMTMGNHGPPRAERLMAEHPQLEGVFDIVEDCKLADLGWFTYDFLEPVEIDGITFMHYCPSGVMGRATGGVNMARSLIRNAMTSVVVGHSHVFDMSRGTRPTGSVVQTLSAGVFCDPNDKAFSYASKAARKMYWPGVMLLREPSNGDYDLEQLRLDRLMTKYGG